MDFVFVALSAWRMRAPAVPAWKRRTVWCRRCQDSRRCRPHLEAPAPPPSLHGSGRPLLLSPTAFRLDAPPATEREPRRTLGGRAHGPRLRRKKTEDALYLGPPVSVTSHVSFSFNGRAPLGRELCSLLLFLIAVSCLALSLPPEASSSSSRPSAHPPLPLCALLLFFLLSPSWIIPHHT